MGLSSAEEKTTDDRLEKRLILIFQQLFKEKKEVSSNNPLGKIQNITQCVIDRFVEYGLKSQKKTSCEFSFFFFYYNADLLGHDSETDGSKGKL